MSRQPQDPYQNSNYRAAEYREPSFIDKLTMGALMGGTVGACAGFLIGGFTVLVYGPQPGGYLKTVAKYMASSGATFATIMGVGSVMRSDSFTPTSPRFIQYPALEKLEKLEKLETKREF